MNVRIKKCHGGEWYSKYIGEIFTVENIKQEFNSNEAKYFVKIKDRKIKMFTERDLMSVWINDVEVV